MLSRLKINRRYRLLGAALGLALLLTTAPPVWLWVSSAVPNASSIPEWQFLLGSEVAAQSGEIVPINSISGTATLQGRTQHDGILVTLDGVTQTTTDASGEYTFPNVVGGVHVLNFSHANYLSTAILVNVEDVNVIAPNVELRGGDVTGDGNIGIDDLTAIAADLLGLNSGPNDVNGDGSTNVGDLAMAGGNFGETNIAPSGMAERVENRIHALRRGTNEQAEEAMDGLMTDLYANLRPVVSKGEGMEQTEQANKAVDEMEQKVSRALMDYANRRDADPNLARRAVDLRLFVSQMREVAKAVGEVTKQCGVDDIVAHPSHPNAVESPCNELVALIDDPNQNANPFITDRPVIGRFPPPFKLYPSYSVALRAPIIPPNATRNPEELVKLIEPIAHGECSSVFKEIRGLQLRLHLDRIVIVGDPWVSVFNVPRGTRIPIWSLEWQPAEYVKTWDMCNENGAIKVAMTQHVKREVPLNYFWRYYSAGHSSK